VGLGASARASSFAFFGQTCALAKMQMCLLCGGCLSKMVLKNVRWEKNKKHWVGLSVGSNVLLKYGLYVVCHLSKWFTFSYLFNGHFLLCRVVIRLQLTSIPRNCPLRLFL
jgi:hypothetical protein